MLDDRRIQLMEYPPDIETEAVDNAVSAVLEQLRSFNVPQRGLPGEILSLRAIVGCALQAERRRAPATARGL